MSIHDNYKVKMSSLCQTISQDGKSVQAEIYDNGEGGWMLEVVDEHGNSTMWEDAFNDDQMALDECLRAINEEGIDAVIGPIEARVSL